MRVAWRRTRRGIDRAAWEDAGGRVVRVGDGDVTLGEVAVGGGVIRVLGTLLAYPTNEFDHPFGLSPWTWQPAARRLIAAFAGAPPEIRPAVLGGYLTPGSGRER